ncbi:MAG TPA: FAD-binding oxidoreductase, partial [Thermoanaerobaculia bacterium]|nr:FAD-binding oxidoreductase [Thermoanaerobaculia bacterium]
GALYVDGDGGVDPVALCRGMLALSGAEVRQGVAVRGLEAAGEGVRVSWAGGEMVARAVVLALDAHVAPLVPALASRLQPVGVEALATAPASRRIHGLWVVGPQGFSLRQLADGTLLATSGSGDADGGGFLETPTAAGQARLEAALQELFPSAERLPVLHRWAGTIARTSDGLPWVRSVPGVPAAAYACGFNGGGMSLGFALGRRLAGWLATQDEAELALFRAAAPAPAPA